MAGGKRAHEIPEIQTVVLISTSRPVDTCKTEDTVGHRMQKSVQKDLKDKNKYDWFS